RPSLRPTFQPLGQSPNGDRADGDPERRRRQSPRAKTTRDTSRLKDQDDGSRKRKSNRLKNRPITKRQYLYIATQIAKWRGESDGLYPDKESSERAFQKRFSFTADQWEQLSQEFMA